MRHIKPRLLQHTIFIADSRLKGGLSLPEVSLAFSFGFLGVLLSPVHRCLVLSKEYFKADLWGIYKRLFPASSVVFVVTLAEYFVLQ